MSKKKQSIKENRTPRQSAPDSAQKALGRKAENEPLTPSPSGSVFVPDELLAAFRSKMVKVQFEHGQDICTVDAEPDGVYFLEEGTAEVLDRDGAQINIMHEGQYFGEYAVLAHQRRLSTVRSMGRTVCYKLEPEDMQQIFAEYPEMYGEILKRLYGQLSKKHEQVLELSRIRRGVLNAPRNRAPMSGLQLLLQYGLLVIIFVLSALFIPTESSFPLFTLPLAMMFIYALITKRTVESLVVSGLYAVLLIYRSEPAGAYSDAIMETMANPDNVSTVFVMALMGAMISLIEGSGSVTAFKKLADRHVKGRKSALFSSMGIMAVTAIDDSLNMVCASQATLSVSDKKRIPHEHLAFIYSFLPTVLSSFVPISLWGIWVIGSINLPQEEAVSLFCRSIPFNFYSLIVLTAAIAFCAGILPKSRRLKDADERVSHGGKLWPAGSERYLVTHEPEMWGKLKNIILPILVLAACSLLMRSLSTGSFMLDSGVGLLVTIIFMYFLYGAQRLMSPDQFIEHIVHGMESVLMPIVLYLLTSCFSAMLDRLSMGSWFDGFIVNIGAGAWALPALLFIASMLLTTVLGSSWSMYAIAFPIAIKMAVSMGVGLPLCIGAVAAAGIAGEKNCALTSEATDIGSSVGCNPEIVKKIRLRYSLIFSAASAAIYLIAGYLSM
ncbi:MAG: cyclic nucleotide-binding domain-containing protein [Lachnospiraceae bacterium]|nr:cyclic nucleotide-binding domain-containing protein [Lachnospiraceae bacterium]